MLCCDGTDAEHDLLDIIDTEEKQLQCIRDLYAIVKAQPKYKTLKEPVFKPETSPIKVIAWLLRRLGPLAKGNRWNIDTYSDKGITRFRYVVFRHYHNQLYKGSVYFPLDFLPLLKKRDVAMHDMIIDLVALTSRVNKIPLWDEDPDYGQQLAIVLDSPVTEGRNSLERQINSYCFGPAAQYLALLKKRRRVVTEPMLREKMANYKYKSQRQIELARWMWAGINLISTRKCIANTTYVPNYVTGTPYTPVRMFKYVWSQHDNDVLRSRAKDEIAIDRSKYGTYSPFSYTIVKPGEKMKPLEKNSFPMDLSEFLDRGYSIVMGRHRQYFYRNQLAEQDTPSEYLIDILDLHHQVNILING